MARSWRGVCRWLAVATIALCLCGVLPSQAASRTDASPPVLLGWGLTSGTAGCDCIEVSVALSSDAPTTIRVEFGTTSALGSVATSGLVPIGTKVGFSLDWFPRPAAGSYYARLIAENSAGSFATPTFGFSVGNDGSVQMAPPTFPPPPPGPPRPFTTLTVASTAPIAVAVGDTVDVRATVTTSAGWLMTPPLGTAVVFTLPGLLGQCIGCALTAVDIVSAMPVSGTCSDLLVCDFGPVGPNTSSSVVLTLRGKTPGTYQLAVQASPSTDPPVKIPFTVIPRVADLAVRPLAPQPRVVVGRSLTRVVTIDNHGPESVSDASLIVGSPRGVTVRAKTAVGTCTPVPVRCAMREIDSGQGASVQLSIVASRAGRFTVPIGVASRESGDSQTANNTVQFLVVAVLPAKRKLYR